MIRYLFLLVFLFTSIVRGADVDPEQSPTFSALTDGITLVEVTPLNQLKVDGSGSTQPVSGTVAVSNFPAFALESTQLTGNASLVSIDAGIPTALGQTTMSGSMSVVIASDQTNIPVTFDGTTPLTDTANISAGVTRTSASIDTQGFGTSIVSVFSSHTCTYTVDWSHDNVTWVPDGDVYSVSVNVLKTSTYGPKFRYMRTVVTMGGTGSTTFVHQVQLKRSYTKPSSHKISEAFNDSTDTEAVKAVISGLRNDSTYGNARLTNGNILKVALSDIADIAGANTENNSIPVVDILSGTGTQGALTVGTTAVLVNVSGSNLAQRKSVSIHNNSLVTIFWGYTSGVTTTTGTPIPPGSFREWEASDATNIYVIAGLAGNNTRVTEAP